MIQPSYGELIFDAEQQREDRLITGKSSVKKVLVFPIDGGPFSEQSNS